MEKINSLPFFDNGSKFIVGIEDYNNNYWHVRYCDWCFEGNPMESILWYLHPKDKPFNPVSPVASTSKKYAGKYYLGTDINRIYIPDNIINCYNGKD